MSYSHRIEAEALAGAKIVNVETVKVDEYGDGVGYGLVRLTLADGRVVELTSCSCCDGLHAHQATDRDPAVWGEAAWDPSVRQPPDKNDPPSDYRVDSDTR